MINQTYAMDEKKTRRFGKIFNTIEFNFSDKPSVEFIDTYKADTPIGTFNIGGKEFELTIEEVRQIQHTMLTVENTFIQRYRMGFYGRR